jgi:hypothetical protein
MFDKCIEEEVKTIVGKSVEKSFLHDVLGAGMPDYVTHRTAIYQAAWDKVFSGATDMRRMELVTNQFTDSSMRCQHSAAWLFYNGYLPACDFSPALYRIAFQIRVRCTTEHELPKQCACGHLMRDEGELILHAFKCELFSTFTRTHRHHLLRDTLIATAQIYGITTTKEPPFYTYAGDELRRPDITFHLPIPIATDVTIVSPDIDVGYAAEKAAKEKVKIHKEAVEKLGHKFIPFATEVYGHMDASCTDLINEIAKQLPPHRQYRFRFEFMYAASIAMAKGRAQTILAQERSLLMR